MLKNDYCLFHGISRWASVPLRRCDEPYQRLSQQQLEHAEPAASPRSAAAGMEFSHDLKVDGAHGEHAPLDETIELPPRPTAACPSA